MVEYRNSDETGIQAADAGGMTTSWNDANSEPTLSKADVVAELERVTLGRVAPAPGYALALAAEAGISAEDFADHYIPTVARSLGAAWCVDQLGFADVTIGVARLQAMLRELGPAWNADIRTHPDASTVLLAVPVNTHHTLGAMVLAGQLRRNGLSVRLVLDATPAAVSDICKYTQFDAIFLSAIVGESLETLRKIVESAKAASKYTVPVVIGGTLLETQNDVKALTGADFVSNTADEAIKLCKLSITPRHKPMLDS